MIDPQDPYPKRFLNTLLPGIPIPTFPPHPLESESRLAMYDVLYIPRSFFQIRQQRYRFLNMATDQSLAPLISVSHFPSPLATDGA